jgi:hypothetical protein
LETGLIAQAKVYGNWLASSPAVIVVNNAAAAVLTGAANIVGWAAFYRDPKP